jgi:Zn-dependent peptidase ImmA (M78 family)
MKTTLNPKLLRWARERAGLDVEELAKKVLGGDGDPERVHSWEHTGELTYRQAELVAEKTHTPFGYLFLEEPPEEKLPIEDFRTVGSVGIARPSPDLLAIIYECQRRQAWFREHLIDEGTARLDFVGKFSVTTPVETTAADIRKRVKIGGGVSISASSWQQNLALHFDAAEEVGILVMRSGVVGNNTHRTLEISEFRGFALCDDYAPLVFINTRDAKAAQLFTLVHEIAHIWLGVSALSNTVRTYADGVAVEKYCNQVAAEVLVPTADFSTRWRAMNLPDDFLKMKRLSGIYKVSSLVIARRARDMGFISREEFDSFYEDALLGYVQQEKPDRAEGDLSGGDFHNTLRARIGSRFCNALIASTLSGKTPYTQAFGLLAVKNTQSFHSFARAKFGHLFG